MPIPIAGRRSGFAFGDRSAPLHLEAFLDIQCPYSAKAWPVLKKIRDQVAGERLRVTLHMMTLGNHRQAWDMTRALHAVAEDDDERFFAFADFLYARQESYFNGAFADRTHNDLIAFAADRGAEHSGRAPDEIRKAMDSDATSLRTRIPIRYAAVKGVWSTPTFFLNDAEATSMGSASTIDDWRALIDANSG